MRMVICFAWRCALCLLAGVGTGARAGDSGTDPAVIVERLKQAYVVNRDGSYTLTVEVLRRIVLEGAAAPHSQYAITYHATLDSVGDIAAYTEKADGRRIAAQVGAPQEAAAAGAPLLQDRRVKVVRFADVAAGDRLALRYVLTRSAALFPGQFEDLSAPDFYRNRDFSLSYDVPDSMPLYADAAGFRPVAVAAAPGRRRYLWRYQPGANRRIEAGSVSYLDYGKRLAVSSFAGYGAFARAFAAGAQAQADPAVAALAAQITGALPADARTRALALSEWVRAHIRYTGAYLGANPVLPRAAGAVLATRYGDCKDHAVLLTALLGAAGIGAGGALINGGDAYRLPAVPTLGILDHMIVHVPGLGLYLDASAKTIAAGYLPPELLDKPVLLLASGKLARTPSRQPEWRRDVLRFQIDQHGNGRFRVVRSGAGAAAEPYRQALRGLGQDQRDGLAGRMLRDGGLPGYGVLEADPRDDGGALFQMALAGVGRRLVDLPGPAALATAFDFRGGIRETVAALAGEKARSQDFVCPAAAHEEESSFVFAPGLRILTLPAALHVQGARLDYRADYRRAGNLVTVRRRLRFKPRGAVCTPGDFRRWWPLIELIQRDLQGQIVLRS